MRLTALIVTAMAVNLTAGVAQAGETPSAPGAKVFFTNLNPVFPLPIGVVVPTKRIGWTAKQR